MKELHYHLQTIDELSARQLLSILRLRSEVFVVEQTCIYNDPDAFDEVALHLSGYDGNTLVSYCRILPPGTRFEHPSIGRVVTAPAARGKGWGKELMLEAMQECRRHYPGQHIHISAQCYLERFYTELGFTLSSQPYDEDGIPHVEMLAQA